MYLYMYCEKHCLLTYYFVDECISLPYYNYNYLILKHKNNCNICVATIVLHSTLPAT